MRELRMEETYGRPLVVDVCTACHGLWLDGAELLQLSARSTIELFRTTSAAASASTALPVSSRMTCPRCKARLVDGTDSQRGTRFHFARCPDGHGRFLTFFQFLLAKNFVRTLTPTELHALREHIRQINCSNCGAAVDVERGAVCGYCRTPVSMIDPRQLEVTVRELQETEAKRQSVDPALPLRLMQERLQAERAFAAADPGWAQTLVARSDRRSIDLVELGLRAIGSFFTR
jgi:Zn-finger nucleic acid-binding protein